MRAASLQEPASGGRPATPGLIATLALFMVAATLICCIAGVALVRKADDRQDIERRAGLIGALADIREAGTEFGALEPDLVRAIERTAGLKGLRFETEPVAGDREVQPVLDRHGRIIGWFSWQPERSVTQALGQLQPLLAVTGLCLVGFAGLGLWQIRRTMRDLAVSERRAWTLAHEDLLTRLPNQRKMIELIDDALSERAPSETVALAILDLDGLKDINGALGHPAGDDLLIALSGRLTELLPARAFGGRFDGDEFAVVVSAPTAEVAESMLEALVQSLARPFWIREQPVQLSATAGVAMVPRHAEDRDDLIRRADLALRNAKRKQRGGVGVFTRALDIEFVDRRFVERELRRALIERALDVHYQPIVSAEGARMIGAEALLRWNHPVRGAIAPATFVSVAEQSGMMGQLGAFALRRACADARRWPDLSIAVNLSPVQVRDPALAGFVADVLHESGLPPSRLVLEVTESVLIDNPEEAQARLKSLQMLGVRLALDDFGTGYSSLTYLQRFRFDTLKIDRSFVEPLGSDPKAQAMIQSIVGLGRALGLRVLAEGVESDEQRVLLRLAGCDEMQGHLFGPPSTRETFDRLVERAMATPEPPPLRAAS